MDDVVDGQMPAAHLDAAYEERTELDDTIAPLPFADRHAASQGWSRSGTQLETAAWRDANLMRLVERVNKWLTELERGDGIVEAIHYAVSPDGPNDVERSRYLGYVIYRVPLTTMPQPVAHPNSGDHAPGRLLPFPARQRVVDDAVAAELARQVVSPPRAASEPPVEPTRDRPAELTALTTGAIERLAQQLNEGHTDGFRAFLAFAARFWEYSAHNALLIQLQRPDATRCAGLRLWNQLGYTVRKGERGIWIWAPMLRRLDDADDQGTGHEGREHLIGFRPAVIFDASQLAEIDDRPLPAPFPVLPDDAEGMLFHCIGQMEAAGIRVSERRLPPGTSGLARPGQVILAPGGDSRNRLFVLLHELAHAVGHVAPLVALLGSTSPDRIELEMRRQDAEFEAESAAYAVAAILGYEHPGARDYLLLYQAKPETLGKHLGAIQRIVQQMLAILGVTGQRPRSMSQTGRPAGRLDQQE